MDEEQERLQRLIAGLRAGDPQTMGEFCTQYGGLLHRLADKHLNRGVRRRVGPEDVAQSAMRTFLRRAQEGQFQLSNGDGLWGLLCAITLNKVRNVSRYHMRRKRGLDQEQSLSPGSSEGGISSFGPAASGPSPAEEAEFADQFQALLAGLDEEARNVLDLKLQGLTHEEVAQRLKCSERTVRRIVKKVQAHLTHAFEGD
jgi:RNA polymerase sigma-70 factor, ECF subfamily